MRLFPIRPESLDGAFAGLLESLGDVPCNMLVDILESLGDVPCNTLVDTLEALGDVADNTLVYTLGSLGDVACNTLVCVVLPWVLSTHISTSPFPLLRAGNYPD